MGVLRKLIKQQRSHAFEHPNKIVWNLKEHKSIYSMQPMFEKDLSVKICDIKEKCTTDHIKRLYNFLKKKSKTKQYLQEKQIFLRQQQIKLNEKSISEEEKTSKSKKWINLEYNSICQVEILSGKRMVLPVLNRVEGHQFITSKCEYDWTDCTSQLSVKEEKAIDQLPKNFEVKTFHLVKPQNLAINTSFNSPQKRAVLLKVRHHIYKRRKLREQQNCDDLTSALVINPSPVWRPWLKS